MENAEILCIILAFVGIALAMRVAFLQYEVLHLKESRQRARDLNVQYREHLDAARIMVESWQELSQKEHAVHNFEHNVRVGRHLIDGEPHERRVNVLENALWDAYTKIGKVFVDKYATIRVLDHIHNPEQVFKPTWESESVEIQFLFSSIPYSDHESEKCHTEGTEIPKGNRGDSAWFPTEVLSRIQLR